MELTCPKCETLLLVSDDELFPSCECGYVFESMPVLDNPSTTPSKQTPLDVSAEDVDALFEEALSEENTKEPAPKPIPPIEPTTEEVTVMTPSKPSSPQEVIIATGGPAPNYQVDKYLGIVASEVVVPEGVVTDELAANIDPEKKLGYQEHMQLLVSSLQFKAHSMGAHAVTNISFQHTILPAGLGGPGVMVFAQGTAVSFS